MTKLVNERDAQERATNLKEFSNCSEKNGKTFIEEEKAVHPVHLVEIEKEEWGGKQLNSNENRDAEADALETEALIELLTPGL